MAQIVSVTKVEAARRQLAMAIALWFADHDPVSIHTLAAAHQIVHDLNAGRKGKPMVFDADFIRKDMRREWMNHLKKAANFFKHGPDKRGGKKPEDAMEFNPELNELFITITIEGLKQLGEQIDEYRMAFYSWQSIQRPQYLTETGRKIIDQRIPIEMQAIIRQMNKREYYERMLVFGREILASRRGQA